MRLAFLIAAVSAAVLGYEIALMRALSMARWHHAAHMVVSVALLGFGASGTLLSLVGRWLCRRFEASQAAFATLFAVAIPVSFSLAQRVPFDIRWLATDNRQYLYLLHYYLLLFVPFFLGATCIGLAFVRETQEAHKLYFWNLVGSGVGAAGMVGMMFVIPTAKLPLISCAAAGLGAVVYATRRRWLWPVASAGTAGALLWFTLASPLELSISELKPLSMLLDAGAEVVEERTSPLGTIHVLDGPMIHIHPELSLVCPFDPPRQRALVVDADAASAINHLADPGEAGIFDYTTAALPYHIAERPSTLILGAGGGSGVLLARYHGCPLITALEVDPVVVDLMRGSQAEFAGGLYDEEEGDEAVIELEVAEARGFLARTDRRYGLIQLPLGGSSGAAGGGVYALRENYLLTVEAVEDCLGHLTGHGILCVTRQMEVFLPSDSIRVLATVTEALRRRGVEDVGRHVIFIRGELNATIVASLAPLTDKQIERASEFCSSRCFRLVWAAGREPGEDVADDDPGLPYYREAVARLLSPERDSFLLEYPLDVTPTTDDRPYHGLSFGWPAVRYFRENYGGEWVQFVEWRWGYILLLATLGQAAVAGLVLIVLPLLFLRRRRAARGGRAATCAYFACLGLAYMFIEIVMIQKLTLFLASPIYAAAVVLASFMIFSGLGSLTAGRVLDAERRAARVGVAGILLTGLALWLGMDGLLGRLAGTALGVRMLVAVACAGSLAFFMGMPFPSGLRLVARRAPALTPWAWGVNGCASVVGAVLAMLLAVTFGFRAVLLAAFALYALAALLLGNVSSRPAPAKERLS